ncbi:hypothetical protein FJZ28_00645 [Candidatus Peregrinibacteria bacterium]|nr:hypothetical protein [Candidatus Peregrinibacteria bacterium]
MAKISPDTQGDWQRLDPQVAERVRAIESDIVIAQVIGTVATDVFDLFNGVRSSADVSTAVRGNLTGRVPGIAADIADQIQEEVDANLTEAIRQEQLLPAGNVIETTQRQTREFAAAIRRAIPSDILSGIRIGEELPEIWNLNLATVNNVDIDLTHDFWQNRIQNRTELVTSLVDATPNDCGLTGAFPLGYTLTQADADLIADSTFGTLTPFHERLLESRTRTLLADNQTSPYNVETAVRLVMNNDNVRRAIAPANAEQARNDLDALREEQGITRVVEQIQTLTIQRFPAGITSWQDVLDRITQIGTDEATLLSRPSGPPPFALTSIGMTGIILDANVAIRNNQISTIRSRLESRLLEMQAISREYTRYAALLSSIIQQVRNVQNRRGTGLFAVNAMVPARGIVADPNEFTEANSPQNIANLLQTQLQLRATAAEYTQPIVDQDGRVRAAERGEGVVTGREALLNVYRTHFRRVDRMDTRRAEEAALTLYSRNEQSREDMEARQEAVEELTGPVEEEHRSWYNPMRWANATSEGMKNRIDSTGWIANDTERNIIAYIARSDTVRAPVEQGPRERWYHPLRPLATPKWSALNYPRLMTAFCALRKLRDDHSNRLHLENTPYFAAQMAEISTLLVDRFHEQLERDLVLEAETDDERRERRQQGEMRRRQRLTRALTNNPLPAEFEGRADAAIKEAGGNIRTIGDRFAQIFKGDTTRTPNGGWSPYTWPARAVKSTAKFGWNRTVELFTGDTSRSPLGGKNPITFPARTTKATWKFLITPLG